MMDEANVVRTEFNKAIADAIAFAKLDAMGEGIALSRNRKLPPDRVMKMVCFFGGNSLTKEIYDYPGVDCAVSSFVEARSKVTPEMFYDALIRFNAQCKADTFFYKDYRLVGIDATCINTAYSPHSSSFVPNSSSAKGGGNMYRVTAFVDLLSRIPVDIGLTTPRQGEFSTALGMLAFNPPAVPTVFVADRLYSSYSFIGELQAMKNTDFVIRTKSGTGALKPIQQLPMDSKYDEDLQIVLTDSQSKASKEAGHIYVPTGSKRGKVNSPNTYISRFSQPLPYIMNIRAVRVKLPSGEWEVLLTSLPRSEFSAEEIAEIYKLRWNIELYFRHIKYDCGLTHMHCRLEKHSQQQIYATFLTSSAIWRIINAVALEQRADLTYEYALNIKMASYLIRLFLRDPKSKSDQLLRDLKRYVVPIRPDRSEERKLVAKSFVPLVYRVA